MPPDAFTTNASEATNAVIKSHVQYSTKSQLNEFIEQLKQVIDVQYREVERAVIGRGKYRFNPLLSQLNT